MTDLRPSAGKSRRAELLRLEIEAECCPQVLLRVLGMIAQQGIMPLTIAGERRDDGQTFLLGLEPMAEHKAEILLAKLEAIIMVSSARYQP